MQRIQSLAGQLVDTPRRAGILGIPGGTHQSFFFQRAQHAVKVTRVQGGAVLLSQALSRQGQNAPVSSSMRRDFETADANEMLEEAFSRLQACSCHSIPVTAQGRLVGLLTSDNSGEFPMIQSALANPTAGQLAQPGGLIQKRFLLLQTKPPVLRPGICCWSATAP